MPEKIQQSVPDQDVYPTEKIHEGGSLSREAAAAIFREIANQGQDGHWPRQISPYMVGRALYRLMSNNGINDAVNVSELMMGLGDMAQPKGAGDVATSAKAE